MRPEKWFFTFGAGQENDGYYVIINNCGFSQAREKMRAKYGMQWCGQYTQTQFIELDLANRMELLEELN